MAQRKLLDEPNAIIIDAADQKKLGVVVGSLVEINGKRARIVGIVEGIRGIGTISVLASFAALRQLSPETEDATTYHLLGLRNGAEPAKVAAALADQSLVKRYDVWTSTELSERSQIYWLLESGVGIGTGFASALALLVGVVITSGTLSGAILASLKEFAALRALGISNASLRNVVLEQSFRYSWCWMIKKPNSPLNFLVPNCTKRKRPSPLCKSSWLRLNGSSSVFHPWLPRTPWSVGNWI